jgi:hypothetical protein
LDDIINTFIYDGNLENALKSIKLNVSDYME